MNKTAQAQWPIITIMIPVRNEAKDITRLLDQLYDQDYPRDCLEIIVCDANSSDGTQARVINFKKTHQDINLLMLENPRLLSSAGRNLAIRNGRGEYFLLIDGHCHIPSRTLVKDAATIALQYHALVLGRPQPLNPPGISSFQQAVALARTSRLAHSQESMIYSSYEGWCSPISIGVMYHRSLFDQVGYFDEQFDAAEDLEFNYRLEKAGIRCYTSPKLAVCYYPRINFSSLYRQLYRYGYGRAHFIMKYPERATLETFVPAGFVLIHLMLLALSFFRHKLAKVWLLLSFVYGIALAAESIHINIKNKKKYYIKIPAIMATIHIGLGTGFLAGLWRWKRDKNYIIRNL
jgi:glycosyltransferase involved in cell wall biosynthesis